MCRAAFASLTALLATAAGCDAATARRPRATGAQPDERPTRVELVVETDRDEAAAARERFRRAAALLGDSLDRAFADSALADSANWPSAVFRFGTTERDGITVWAGDTLRLAPPEPPPGAPDAVVADLRWRSYEPNIATVSQSGLVIAHRPGVTTIGGWRRVGQVLTPVTVLPALRGRVRVAGEGENGDDGPEGAPLEAELLVRANAKATDTVRVAPDGGFVWRGHGPVDARIAIDVVPTGRSAARYFAGTDAAVAIESDGARDGNAPVDLVLIPRRWRVAGGSYAGSTVAIDSSEVHARMRDNGRRATRAAGREGSRVRHAVGWPSRHFPIPVAADFRPDHAGRADSAAFWAAARQLERDWGTPLFEPAPPERARDPGWLGIVVQIDPRLPTAGLTTTTAHGDGALSDAVVAFRTHADARDPGVVTHELLHALGVGHSARQESVMRARGPIPPRATAEDVAYGRLLYGLVRRERDAVSATP